MEAMQAFDELKKVQMRLCYVRNTLTAAERNGCVEEAAVILMDVERNIEEVYAALKPLHKAANLVGFYDHQRSKAPENPDA